MVNLQTRLFRRLISRNREIYFLKIITLAIAFSATLLIITFSINEIGYDRHFRDADRLFRVIEKNTRNDYSGNRLSSRISDSVTQLLTHLGDSMLTSRLKIMNDVNVVNEKATVADQKIHAADISITTIFSFDIVTGDIKGFQSNSSRYALISSEFAMQQFGKADVVGKKMKLFTFGDTVTVNIAAVFRSFPENTHEKFNLIIAFDSMSITRLNFNPGETGVYGRVLHGDRAELEQRLNRSMAGSHVECILQPLSQIHFGPRVLYEDAAHGDIYSVVIVITIASLILFLSISSFVNLTTLTLPARSKELAVKKLAGISQRKLLFDFLRESAILVTYAFVLGALILLFAGQYFKSITSTIWPDNLLHADKIMLVCLILFILFTVSPVIIAWRFIRATPTRLLHADAITFPKFKRIITILQLGVSIFLIISSLVVRRQINYSLVKEPGRNHDQVVYLNCPGGITNEGIVRLRTGWKQMNPNILDVMAVSQLPDRINSKDVGSPVYSLLVDRGFRDFFGMNMIEGQWFGPNDGDSIVVINSAAKAFLDNKDAALVTGVIEDFGGRFNQPEKPIKIRLADDYNYNWLCVRVVEVNIRKTADRLEESFSTSSTKASVRYLDKNFAAWLTYQDQLNTLSGMLAIVSALLAALVIYGLTVSLVRDKLKQIALHKLFGATEVHITGLLVNNFARQLSIAMIIFVPVTYVALSELLRTFVYAIKFSWRDPLYPVLYCALVIIGVCAWHSVKLNKSDLNSKLKGE